MSTYIFTLITLLCSATEQFSYVVSLNHWNGVRADCSGSVRAEHAIRARSPSVRVRSDDARLLSCGVATGRAFPPRFPVRFGFIEVGVRSSFGRTTTGLVVHTFVQMNTPDCVHYRARTRHEGDVRLAEGDDLTPPLLSWCLAYRVSPVSRRSLEMSSRMRFW